MPVRTSLFTHQLLMLLVMNACLKSSTWSRCACTERQLMALGQADHFWFRRLAASSGGGHGSSNSVRFVACFQVALLPAKFHS